ncbi:MAG: 30S ribosomal protein S30, partial [Erythrobacteraceae bacterium]|nr:30S ribosomal protein S30 [Erythrobacteraceae bacterium]HAV81149.1 30S ribosomal protein S30 [Erythrobacter sp.]
NGLLFKNGGSGEHNMVYRRHDGSIGWVEPR